ncbi:unnamed protein product [Acanthoscelides obtectus]|uniref:Uncharacterized protein n=1 Tax=Acanthoscelides obtectus TaxID=200917 RepID=A0A9P0LUG7_ACAOB|nr:unnamed protein product [Acanthoscelides obtectus]CAK1626539.1 hypothetical protein AOBTE_LOCUS3912 [Acanthoscelides obtectus]
MKVFVVSSLLLAIHCHDALCKKDRSSRSNSKRGIFDDFGGSHENYVGNGLAFSNENSNGNGGNGPYGGGYSGSYRDSYGAAVGGAHAVPNSIAHTSQVAVPQHYPFVIPKRVPVGVPPSAVVQIPRPVQIPVHVPQHLGVPQRPIPVPVRVSVVPQPLPQVPPPPHYQAPQQGPSRVPKTIIHEQYPHYPVSQHQPIQYQGGHDGGYESGYEEGYQGHYGGGYGHEGVSYATSVFHQNPHGGYSGHHHYPGGATSYSSVYKQ